MAFFWSLDEQARLFSELEETKFFKSLENSGFFEKEDSIASKVLKFKLHQHYALFFYPVEEGGFCCGLKTSIRANQENFSPRVATFVIDLQQLFDEEALRPMYDFILLNLKFFDGIIMRGSLKTDPNNLSKEFLNNEEAVF